MSVKAPLVLPPSRDAIWWFPCRLRRARWPYRFTLLLLSVVVVFSGYYAFDLESITATALRARLGINNTQFGALFSVYSMPNTVLPMLSGVLFAKAGKWKGIGIITSVITLGVLVVYIGVSTASYGLTLFGRVLYGLGGESVYVGVDILVTKWFAGAEIGLAYGLVQAAAQAGSFGAFYLAPPLLTVFGEYLPSVYAVSLGISLTALASLGLARLVEVSGRGPPRSAAAGADTSTTPVVTGPLPVSGADALEVAIAAVYDDAEAVPGKHHDRKPTGVDGADPNRSAASTTGRGDAIAIPGGGNDGHPHQHHHHRRDKGAGKKHSAAEMVAARLVDGSYQGHHNKVATKFAAEGIAPPAGAAGKHHHHREGRSNTSEGASLLGAASSIGGRKHTESTPLLAGAPGGGSRKQPVTATPLLLAASPPLPSATSASSGPSLGVSAVSPGASADGVARGRVETLTLAEPALAVGVDAAAGGAYSALAAVPPPQGGARAVVVAPRVDKPAAASSRGAHDDDHHHDDPDDGEDPAVTEAMARLNPWRHNRAADAIWRLFGIGHIVTLSVDFWLVLGAIAAYSSAVYTFLAFGVSWLQADYGMDDDPAGRLIGIVSICSCFISPAGGLVLDKRGGHRVVAFIALVGVLAAFIAMGFGITAADAPVVAPIAVVAVSYSLCPASLYPLLYEVIPDESFTVVYAALNSAINILLTVSYAVAGALSNQGTGAASDSVSATAPTAVAAGRASADVGGATLQGGKIGNTYTGVFVMLIALAALGVACTAVLLWRRVTGRSAPVDADDE